MTTKHGITSADTAGIERVLEVLLDPLEYPDLDGWRSEVLRVLGPLLGADKTSFQLPWPGLDLLYSEDTDRQLLRVYAAEHVPQLVRRKQYNQRLLELGVGNHELFWGDDLPWLFRSEYYNELIVPLRAHDPVWSAVPMPGTTYPAVLLAHHERPDARRFGDRELDIMRLLRPAFGAAVAAVHRLDAHRQALVRTIDSVTTGALVYGPAGELLHSNPAAQDMFERDPDAADLRAAAAQVARSAGTVEGAPGVHRSVRTRLQRYRMAATRLPLGPGQEPATLVLLEPERRALPSLEEVRKLRLTRRQAEVALLLAQRKTNAEIAEILGIRENTARHHTEAVMLILGVASRRDVGERLAQR